MADEKENELYEMNGNFYSAANDFKTQEGDQTYSTATDSRNHTSSHTNHVTTVQEHEARNTANGSDHVPEAMVDNMLYWTT